ncbi:N-acetylglucosamine kinase [Cohnella thermotolerans]|uniref:N-acetylglucosamine kinase n=1 Tax=Cohnella thermotolerans TaxID=329858 RepID=UPI000408FB07|nr:BadF/BadG/BcrA/BcrD ATPase family protein [Cohnella thermotolerans]
MTAAGPSYVIGVDGGNSKTDYFLFDAEGGLVDHSRAGTCSHERFPDGYESSYRIMNVHIRQLLARNRLSMESVAAGAFGLAGADIPSQKRQLRQVVERIGFTRYAVDNDSFLGIKAGIEAGFGVCSVNGSGAVTGGISPSGARLQVGGVGSELSGDEAGGFYLARRTLRAVYDAFYRMGPPTQLTEPVLKLLGVPAKEHFLDCALEGLLDRTLPTTEMIRLLFAAADAGDAAAMGIVDHSARQLALSTAGCIHNLDFGPEVDIVLAGSVWVKAESPLLADRYRDYVAQLTDRRCRFLTLHVPPAAGAVLWALELVHGQAADAALRRKVVEAIERLKL